MPNVFTLITHIGKLLTQSIVNLLAVTANYTLSTKLHEILLHSTV